MTDIFHSLMWRTCQDTVGQGCKMLLINAVAWSTMCSVSAQFVLAALGTMVIAVFVYLKSMLKSKNVLPKLYFKPSALTKHLLKRCQKLKVPYVATFWASGPHLQTLVRAILPAPNVQFRREYLQMRDHGIVALDWVIVSTKNGYVVRNSSPVMMIVPAWSGDALTMRNLCYEATQKGFRVVVVNSRGHGNSLLTTPKMLSLGDPSDLRQVVKYIRGLLPKARITAVGIGTGASPVLSYLGEFGSSSYISACVCLSPTYDITNLLSNGGSAIYRSWTLFQLQQILNRHAKGLSRSVNIAQALKARTLADFQMEVFARIYNCKTSDEYWERNDPLRDADEIAVPVLCINSQDDPVSSKDKIPFDLFRYYPNFLLVLTEKGGHCGFLEGLKANLWAERIILDYLEAVLDFTSLHGDR